MKHYVRSKENRNESKLRQCLIELGKKHEDLIVLDADLAAATQTGMFKKEFPERHIDCGIAECNMMVLQQESPPQVRFPLQVLLQCLQQDVLMSRFVTPLDIRS